MRYTGTQARGIRLPIINPGDPLAEIVADYIAAASEAEGFTITEKDIVGVTEAIVAKSQGNLASLDQLAADVRKKYPDGKLGVVFPMLSRNRFFNILKGLVRGADETFVLLSYPADEVGNPIMDIERIDEIFDALQGVETPIPAAKFKEVAGEFLHPFTHIDYIDLYESAGAKVYFSNDPRDILKLTPHVVAADIHTRHLTKTRLKKAGAQTVYALSDLLTESVDGGGFHPECGVLGSNISTGEVLKLFPRDCNEFALQVAKEIEKRTGIAPEVLVFGDGAFKDPLHGIWELADPVVSPGYTSGLEGTPNEIKIKMIADTQLKGLSGAEQEQAMREAIKNKDDFNLDAQLGTTPRRYADLLGSLCDLISGSGDKGTPVILIQGYFDSYAD